jgi:GAF domain-containing protein
MKFGQLIPTRCPSCGKLLIIAMKQETRLLRQTRTMETLGRISLALNATRDLSKLLELICKESSELFNVGAAFIWLLEGEDLVGFAGYGYRREDFIGLRVSLLESPILGPRVIREKRPIYVNDAPNSEKTDPNLITHFNTKAILGTPLIADNQAIGALMLLDTEDPYKFREEDIELAELLGSHAAIAITNARLYEEISERVKESNQRNAELEALRKASFHLTANLEFKPLLEAILEEAMQLIDATDVHIFLYSGNQLSFGAARWADKRHETPYKTVRSDGLTATVAREGKAIIIPNVNEHDLFKNWQWGGAIAGFPLKIGEEIVGVMNIAVDRPHYFDDNEQRILKLFADEAAIAIKNAQLFEATRRQLGELTVLHSIAVAGVTTIDENTLIETTTKLIGDTFYPHNFGVLLLDESKQVLHIHPSYRLENKKFTKIDVSDGIVGRVATTGEAIRLDDVSESEHYLEGDKKTRSELCVPLKVGDRIMGVINAESRRPKAFTDSDERLLTTLANQLAIALERLRTQSAERLQRRRLLIISELAREMTGVLKVQELCKIVAERICSAFDYFNVSIFLVSSDSREIVLQHIAGAYSSFLEFGNYKQAFGEGVIGQAAETGLPQVFNNTNEAAEFFDLNDMPILSEAALPLKVGDRVIGVLNVDSSELNAFSPGDIATLTAVSDQLAIAIEKARLFEETSQRSEDLQSAQDILQALNAHPKVVNTFPGLSKGLKKLTNCDRVSIALLEENDTWFSIYALDQPRTELAQGTRMPVAMTACATNVLAGQSHLTPILEQEISYPAEKALFDAGHRSRINIPLYVEERVIGTLNLVWSYENGYDPSQLPLLSQIAQAIALAVEKTHLFTEARQRAKELDLLNKIISATATAQTGIEVLQIGCKEMALFFDVPQAALALLDETRKFGTVVAEYLAPGRLPVIHQQIPVENNPYLQEVLETGLPLAIENVQKQPVPEPVQELFTRRGTISLLLIPIPVRGRIVGTLGIDAVAPRTFASEELQLVKVVGEELGRALETAELHEQLQAHAAELEERVSERTKELAEANEQLKELDRLKSKFVSDVSHELRTPVANLWLYLDLLERGRVEKHDHYLEVLKQETRRLEQLIENTLSLSRLEMTDYQTAFELVDLNAIINQIIFAYRPRADIDNLAFTFTPKENMPLIQGVKNQLSQVVNNLLSNAFNYTIEGFVHVRTCSDDQYKQAILEVIDSGIGIDPEDMPHLFDRFYRGQQTGQSDIPGTGLGLAIAKEVVDLHRGVIEVDSSQQGQTIFRVKLPYTQGNL